MINPETTADILAEISHTLSAILDEQRKKNGMLQITIDLQREANARYMAQTAALKEFTRELDEADKTLKDLSQCNP